MRSRPIAAITTFVAVALMLALPQVGLAQRRLRDRDGPSEGRVESVELIREARKLAGEATVLRTEAIEGKVPDRSKPAGDGESKRDRWIDLTDQERLTRFAGARNKYLQAVKKAAEAEEFVKKHPNVMSEDVPEVVKGNISKEYALTYVAEARFRMQKQIGTIADWQKLAAQALKIDKDSDEAQRLTEELKEMVEAEKARKKAELEQKKAELKKKREEEKKAEEQAGEKKEDAGDEEGKKDEEEAKPAAATDSSDKPETEAPAE